MFHYLWVSTLFYFIVPYIYVFDITFIVFQALIKKVLQTWGDTEPPIFLIEPELLYKILEQINYSENEDLCTVFCHAKAKTISFGVFADQVYMVRVY